MHTDYFTEPKASELAKLRIEARGKRRITYDCLNAIVHYPDRVECKMRHPIGHAKSGSMALITVLSGRSSSVCQDCEDYEADEVVGRIIGQKVYD